jgi:hypothetical protein
MSIASIGAKDDISFCEVAGGICCRVPCGVDSRRQTSKTEVNATEPLL